MFCGFWQAAVNDFNNSLSYTQQLTTGSPLLSCHSPGDNSPHSQTRPVSPSSSDPWSSVCPGAARDGPDFSPGGTLRLRPAGSSRQFGNNPRSEEESCEWVNYKPGNIINLEKLLCHVEDSIQTLGEKKLGVPNLEGLFLLIRETAGADDRNQPLLSAFLICEEKQSWEVLIVTKYLGALFAPLARGKYFSRSTRLIIGETGSTGILAFTRHSK